MIWSIYLQNDSWFKKGILMTTTGCFFSFSFLKPHMTLKHPWISFCKKKCLAACPEAYMHDKNIGFVSTRAPTMLWTRSYGPPPQKKGNSISPYLELVFGLHLVTPCGFLPTEAFNGKSVSSRCQRCFTGAPKISPLTLGLVDDASTSSAASEKKRGAMFAAVFGWLRKLAVLKAPWISPLFW